MAIQFEYLAFFFGGVYFHQIFIVGEMYRNNMFKNKKDLIICLIPFSLICSNAMYVILWKLFRTTSITKKVEG